jgi:antitoxin ParD1/3/4
MISAKREAGMADTLRLDLERSIDDLVGTGRYASRQEVFRDGVRLVSERESRLRELDESLARSLADVRAGRVTPAEEVFDTLPARYRAMADSRS